MIPVRANFIFASVGVNLVFTPTISITRRTISLCSFGLAAIVAWLVFASSRSGRSRRMSTLINCLGRDACNRMPRSHGKTSQIPLV